MKITKKRISFAAIVCFVMLSALAIFSREIDYTPIDLSHISNYDLDRVVYQRIEKTNDINRDDSFESLLIIKDKKMFLLMDGFDYPFDAKLRRFKAEAQNLYSDTDADIVWMNKMNGKPDYIEIMDRRSQMMKNSNEEFVSTNFGGFYKSIRDKYIKEHVDKYRNILRNRRESDIYVERKSLRRPLGVEDITKYQDKFYTLAKGKAQDGSIYMCEDADGDGVTETFMVDGKDGFGWGYKSGPSLLYIYKNTDKDVETLIGKLCNESIFGSVEDEKAMIETFPKEKDIEDLIKWLNPTEKIVK